MKKVKIITITLISLIIAMVAFVGIYLPKQKSNRMHNVVKEFKLSPDIYGQRHIRLQISEVNEEAKKEENYIKVKEIIEKRLEKIVAEEYSVALNKSTGTIDINLAENDYTDEILSVIIQSGTFEIIDTKTKEVLMNNSDLESVNVGYGGSSQSSEAQSVSVEYKFNEQSIKKLEDITNKYVKTEKVQTEEDSEETQEAKNTVTILVSGQNLIETDFETPITTGSLYLNMGTATTDAKELNKTLKEAGKLKIVLEEGKFPVQYELSGNKLVLGNINAQEIINISVIVVILVGLLVLTIKYRTTGIFGTILLIGSMSVYILVLKYANVAISVNSLLLIPLFGVINIGIIAKIINEIKSSQEKAEKATQKANKPIKEILLISLPLFIISIVFTFGKITTINSFGMTMFWGLSTTLIYAGIYTKALKMKEGNDEN